jgi:hypothetical protein
MVLDEAIRIATVMMVVLRNHSRAGVTPRKDQLGFGHMRGVAAH